LNWHEQKVAIPDKMRNFHPRLEILETLDVLPVAITIIQANKSATKVRITVATFE